MKSITSLRSGKRQRNRVNVFLDGRFAFSLQAEAIVKEGLQVGQELSTSRIDALSKSDDFQRCLEAAIRYLSYRPRSEPETRAKLQQRGFDSQSIESALLKLRKQGLVDDMLFGQFWKDTRQSFSPRSQRLTKLELRQKGVDKDIIDRIVGDLDDNDSAYRAAVSKARSLSLSDSQLFRRRMGEYLRRRGFDYQVINHTVERILQEHGTGSG